MSGYVAFYLPESLGGDIYGVAKCDTAEETARLVMFADENNIRIITGDLHEPDKLIEVARDNPMFRLSHS